MTMIIGHRGGRNVWPENSLTGFRKVRDLAVDGVELDVHRTAGGDLVVIHDATLDRTTHGTGPVAGLPRGGYSSVMLRGADEAIPDLDSVLALFAGTDLELHIELKDDVSGTPYAGLAEAVLGVIDRHGLGAQSFVTSFSISVLRAIRELSPETRLLSSLHAPLVENEGLVEALQTRLAVVDVIAIENAVLKQHWSTITSIVPLDRLGGWVSNSEDDLRYWLSQGMRQITTDEPVRALALRQSP